MRGAALVPDTEAYRKSVMAGSTLVYYCPNPLTGKDIKGNTSGTPTALRPADGVKGLNEATWFDGTGKVNGGNVCNVAAAGTFTLEAWVMRMASSGDNGRIFGKETIASPYNGYTLALSGGKLYFYVNTSGASHYRDTTGQTVLNPGQLYHVAATLTVAGEVNVYLDGSPDNAVRSGDASVTGPADSSNSFTIGDAAEGSTKVKLVIAHVAVYSTDVSTSFAQRRAALLR